MAASQYILGIDYGNKRVGVAVAHTVARLPRPLTTLPNDASLFDTIGRLVEREDAGLVVVGLPRGMDGGYTAQTRIVEEFAKKLQAALPVSVELADETLTSIDAESSLGDQRHTKADIDAVAASLILERYITEHPVGVSG